MGFNVIRERENEILKEYKENVILSRSNHSYNVNLKITDKFNKDSWLYRRCFILGGGPSLKKFDFSRLDKELTIGINKSFQIYQNATINYSMDHCFYDSIYSGELDKYSKEKLLDKWVSFKGIKVFLTPMELKKFKEDVYLVRRKWEEGISRENLDSGIWGGINSATGALNLAISLGATQIYLLGYDFYIDGNNTHFHSGYPNRNLKEFSRKLIEYKEEITKLHPLIHQTNIKVYNCDFGSKLICFPFKNIDEVLK